MKRHTIGKFTHPETDTWLDFGIRGDKFFVSYSSPTAEAEQTFETPASAGLRYTKLIGWVLIGAYSEKGRIQFLKTGTMD